MVPRDYFIYRVIGKMACLFQAVKTDIISISTSLNSKAVKPISQCFSLKSNVYEA